MSTDLKHAQVPGIHQRVRGREASNGLHALLISSCSARRLSMVSWASVAQKAAPKSGAPPPDAFGADEPVAVLDANAVIGGLSVQRALDRLVTIPEVLQEVRDKQSREALAALPFRVELAEPSDESLHAGVQSFAPLGYHSGASATVACPSTLTLSSATPSAQRLSVWWKAFAPFEYPHVAQSLTSQTFLQVFCTRGKVTQPGNTHGCVRAVTRFARATGDLHSLSTVDLRLMALARTLEVAAHGDSHLRDLPVRRPAPVAVARDTLSHCIRLAQPRPLGRVVLIAVNRWLHRCETRATRSWLP